MQFRRLFTHHISTLTAMRPTPQAPRKRPDEEALTTEDPKQVPKRTKTAGISPGLTTPGAKGAASKKRSHEPGQHRGYPTPASRPQKASPTGALTSTAAVTLANLAEGAMSLKDYHEECKVAKAKRSRRGPDDHPPAKPSPAAAAADKPKRSKPPSKPVEAEKRKGKMNKKKGKAAPAPTPPDSDVDSAEDESLDDSDGEDDPVPIVDQPPEKVEALSGERQVRPLSLSPPATAVLYHTVGPPPL